MKRNGLIRTVNAARERLTVQYDAGYAYELPSASALQAQRESLSAEKLKFSILVPAFETPVRFLTELLDSVRAQSYPNWELILADASASDSVQRATEAYRQQYGDDRIRYYRLEANGGISENTNAALNYATGDYCGLLDHDDLLTPDALYEMAAAILRQMAKQHEAPAFLYSDEDKYDDTDARYFQPNRKRDFNLDLILSNHYICHFLVMKTSLIRHLRFRKEFDGSQDYDLTLRAVKSVMEEINGASLQQLMPEHILHIPKVLYHWRCHAASTAANPASKSYAYEAGKRAIVSFLESCEWRATVEDSEHVGFYHVNYQPDCFTVRNDIAAVGGSVINRNHMIVSGLMEEDGSCPFAGMPLSYAGPCNIASVAQDCTAMDARAMLIRRELIPVYEQILCVPYVETIAERDRAYTNSLDEHIWRQRSLLLAHILRERGYTLLWDPAVHVQI